MPRGVKGVAPVLRVGVEGLVLRISSGWTIASEGFLFGFLASQVNATEPEICIGGYFAYRIIIIHAKKLCANGLIQR